MSLNQKLTTAFVNAYGRFVSWLRPHVEPIPLYRLKYIYLFNIIFFLSCNILIVAEILAHPSRDLHPARISLPSHLSPYPAITTDFSKSQAKFRHLIDSLSKDSLGMEWLSRMKLQEPPLIDSIDQFR